MERWVRARFTPNMPLGPGGKRVTACREHIELSKNAAKEGMVLLKNNGGILPLAPGSRVALFGKGTIDYVKGGGGSGDVTVPYIRNLAQGFEALNGRVHVFRDTVDFYQAEVDRQYAEGVWPGMLREPELPEELLRAAAAYTDTAIISISRFSGEGWDRKSDSDPLEKHIGVDPRPIEMANAVFERGDFYLSKAEEKMVEQVKARFARVIVVLNVGGMFDTSWFADDDRLGAVLLAWQGGLEGGLAAAELLTGLGNPSGKLSDTFARELSDYPSTQGFYTSDKYVDYTEDIYVGYRYFETIPGAAEKVVYPFGYGLSYTDFAVTEIGSDTEDTVMAVMADVANVGEVAGREVVQLYLEAPQGKLGKPARQLAAYRKTRLLQPGESQTVTLSVDLKDFASFDDLGKVQANAYVLEAGTYRLHLGTSVRDTEAVDAELTLDSDLVVKQCKPLMAPTQLKERLTADGAMEALPLGVPNDPDSGALQPHISHEDAERLYPPFRAYPSHKVYPPAETPMLKDVADGKITLDAFIATLTDEDLIWLCGGQDNTGVANTFGIGNNPLRGIPNIMTADGPAGLRIREFVGVRTTAFPCSTLMACTWDPDIAYAVGAAGGAEVKENNICVWLTPAVNIHRNPLCGRNFEYYSEDPFLAGMQAAAMVNGIQSQGVGASVKHFALNDKETNRKDCDSRASMRAIREIYLKQFEIIVKRAHPWTIMSSYNIINGHRASENSDMLKGILRDEWGWDGMVTTDWWTYGEHYKEVAAGNDLKMASGHPERLAEALKAGAVTRADLELAVKHILGLILRVE